jgi:hypothetical protein
MVDGTRAAVAKMRREQFPCVWLRPRPGISKFDGPYPITRPRTGGRKFQVTTHRTAAANRQDPVCTGLLAIPHDALTRARAYWGENASEFLSCKLQPCCHCRTRPKVGPSQTKKRTEENFKYRQGLLRRLRTLSINERCDVARNSQPQSVAGRF